jgi:hypothetical protein
MSRISTSRHVFALTIRARLGSNPEQEDKDTMNPKELTQNLVRGLVLFVVAGLLLVSPASLALSVPVEVPPTDGDTAPPIPDDADIGDVTPER